MFFCNFHFFILFASIFCSGFCDENEYRLTKYLLSNYERSVRPVANSSLPIIVIFGMSIHHIIDVDEKNQIITVNCWLDQTWNDTHLTWNSSDFGGITTIGLPYDKVWRPDIILYNNADASYNTAVINTNVMVNANGEVKWLSHGIFKSSCDISVEYFPFDIQICKMKWASWTYDSLGLDLFSSNEGEGDMTNYQENGEFKLESFRAEKSYVYYSCCPNPFPDITFFIELRRRPMFYVFNLILPCVLINGIALLVFYVPSESGEKVTLGISALLSMTVFLMTIRESLPPTEKTPLISLYYGVSICLVSFASAMAVVTLNIHHRGQRGAEVPYIIRRYILNYLSRAVFLNFDEGDTDNPTASRASTTAQHNASAKASVTSPATASTTEMSLKDLQPFVSTEGGDGDVAMTMLAGENQIHSNNIHRHQHQHMVFNSDSPGVVHNQPRMVNIPGMVHCHSSLNHHPHHQHLQQQQQFQCAHSHQTCHANNHRRPSYGAAINRDLPPHLQQQQQQFLPDQMSESESATLRLRGHSTVHTCCNGPVLHGNLLNQCSSGSIDEDLGGVGGVSRCLHNNGHNHQLQQQAVCLCQIPKTSLDFVLFKISQTIDETKERATSSDRHEQSSLEWKKVSLVVDRFLLLQFFLAMTIASLVILTSSPHLYTSSLAEIRKANQTKMAEAQQSQTANGRPIVGGEH